MGIRKRADKTIYCVHTEQAWVDSYFLLLSFPANQLCPGIISSPDIKKAQKQTKKNIKRFMHL